MGLLSQLIESQYSWALILFIVLLFTFITVIFYYTRDKYEPEPFSRIFVAYVYGIISVIPAIIISLIGIEFTGGPTIFFGVVLAPVIEEFCKGIFVIRLSKHESFDGPLDGLIYGSMVGSGFATIENLLYGYGASYISISAGVQLAFFRSIPQIVGHPLYTGLMGIGVGAYKVGLNNNKYQQIWQAILLHSSWNGASSMINPEYFLLSIGIVVSISIYLLRKELGKAIELDRLAYERGYYEQKRIYLEQQNQMYNNQIWHQ